jgi:hypothetical protein
MTFAEAARAATGGDRRDPREIGQLGSTTISTHNTQPNISATQLRWKRNGTDWLLYLGRRRLGRVVPDAKWTGMYRSVLSGGRLSDMANLSWSKNAVLDAAVRELEFEARHKPATDPQKSQEKGGVLRHTAPYMQKNGRGLS